MAGLKERERLVGNVVPADRVLARAQASVRHKREAPVQVQAAAPVDDHRTGDRAPVLVPDHLSAAARRADLDPVAAVDRHAVVPAVRAPDDARHDRPAAHPAPKNVHR